jgi:hypothetical protein
METDEKIALVIGGAENALEDYAKACALCLETGKMWTTFVCNDTIQVFPEHIDHAVTLHPDKMHIWTSNRRKAGFADVGATWCHRPYKNFTNDTRDWGGSSGLLCVKIARVLKFRHVILCGVPMTVEAGHITRKKRWQAAHGFRRGWSRHVPELKPFVRSMNGWTKELFLEPTVEWLRADIPDPTPPRHEHEALKA